MECTLDRGVVTLLTGLDLDKYIPLFQKSMVNMQLFLSLNEEDIKEIGIEDKNDIELLLKYITKFQRNKTIETIEPFKIKKLEEILRNTESHLDKLDAATSYVYSKTESSKSKDSLLPNNKSMSSVISMYCDHFETETNELIDDIDRLIKKIEIQKPDIKPTSS